MSEDPVEYEMEYEIHRRNILSTICICKQRMHLFHMSENRFSFLGGYPDGFRSGVCVGGVLYVASLDQYKTL